MLEELIELDPVDLGTELLLITEDSFDVLKDLAVDAVPEIETTSLLADELEAVLPDCELLGLTKWYGGLEDLRKDEVEELPKGYDFDEETVTDEELGVEMIPLTLPDPEYVDAVEESMTTVPDPEIDDRLDVKIVLTLPLSAGTVAEYETIPEPVAVVSQIVATALETTTVTNLTCVSTVSVTT